MADRFFSPFQQVFTGGWASVVVGDDGTTLHSTSVVGGFLTYSKSTDEGKTWSAPVNIASSNDNILERPLAVSGNFVHVIYFRSNDLYYRRSTDGGATWTEAEVLLHDGVTNQFYRGGIACSGATVHITYARINNSSLAPIWQGQMYYRRSTDNGATMGAETEPYPNGATYSSASRPNLCVSGSTVHLTWAGLRTGNTILQDEEINTGRSTDGGVTWGARTIHKVASASFAHRPDIHEAGDGSTLVVIWQEGTIGGASSELDLYMQRSTDDGASWSATTRLTNLAGTTEHAFLAARDSKVAVVYAEYSSGSGRATVKFSDDAGATWTDAQTITTALTAPAPSAAISNNYLQVLVNPSNIQHSRSIWLAPVDPVQTTLIDSFNRADDAVPPPGVEWTNGVLTFVADEGIAVLSNHACRKSTGGYRQGGYYNVSTPGPDLDVVAEVAGLPGTNGDGLFLYGKLANVGTGATDGYGYYFERTSAAVWTSAVNRVDNTATTAIGAAAASKTVALAVGDLFGIQFRGSIIRLWHKPVAGAWQIVNEVIDSTYSAAGFVGLEFVRDQTGKVTNLWATTIEPAPVVSELFHPAIHGGVHR